MRHVFDRLGLVGQELVEPVQDDVQPLSGSRIGSLRADPWGWTHRGYDAKLVLHAVEDHDQRGPHENAVGQAEVVGLAVGQVLDQPHRIVAHIAENAGRHGRQRLGQCDLGFGQQRAQALKRRLRGRRERIPVGLGAAVDFGLVALRPPNHIRFAADDRVAAAIGTALDGLEQKAVGPLVCDLEHGGDGRFQIGHEARPDHLRHALVIEARERREVRLHRGRTKIGQGRTHRSWRRTHGSSPLPVSLASAWLLIFTP